MSKDSFPTCLQLYTDIMILSDSTKANGKCPNVKLISINMYPIGALGIRIKFATKGNYLLKISIEILMLSICTLLIKYSKTTWTYTNII